MSGEYISREAAIAFMDEVEPCICYNPAGEVFTVTKDKDLLEFLRAIPAADVVEVRHATWIEDGYYSEPCVCSNCGEPGKPEWRFCPNCGARCKDGGQDDGEHSCNGI